MLSINFKKLVLFSLIAYAGSSILFATDSYAVFGALVEKGVEIFVGLREIIFAVAGFGIIAVAIGGFFGNLNWKWLAAIGIGLFVISTTAAIIDYMVGQQPGSLQDVQSGLKSGQ